MRHQAIWFALVGALASWPQASPAYQISLTQKGFTQFVEYDAAVPPLSEFTFCLRLRTVDLTRHQPIFTYLVNGNVPLISLWLERGGANLHTQLGASDAVEHIAPVDWSAGAWRQLCMSWQSHSGAWALYQDGSILACEASDKCTILVALLTPIERDYSVMLIGYVFPGGGRILLGYGASNKIGSKNGWEGNLSEFNMILSSTIERNNSIHETVRVVKSPTKKMIEQSPFQYVVIGDLDAENTNDISEADVQRKTAESEGQNFLKFTTPYSHVEHEVGIHLEMKSPVTKKMFSKFTQKGLISHESEEPEFLDIHQFQPKMPDRSLSMLWKIINKAGSQGKFKTSKTNFIEQTKLGTEDLHILSEFETPPPPSDPIQSNLHNNEITQTRPAFEEVHNNFDIDLKNIPNQSFLMNQSKQDVLDMLPTLSDMETPPKLEVDEKVYGHWAGSTFPGAVLGFLKNKKFYSKRIPNTIPLKKFTDTLPYASEQNNKITIPYQVTFQKSNILPRVINAIRRYARSPEINVKIMGESIRNIIAQQHAKEKAINVEVSHRGELTDNFGQNGEHESGMRYHPEPSKLARSLAHPEPFRLSNHNMESSDIFYQLEPNKVPFLLKQGATDLVAHSSKGNKWRNIQSFNNDLTPRGTFNNFRKEKIDDNIFSDNLNSQSLPRLSFQHSPPQARELELNKNRAIAYEVSKEASRMNKFIPSFSTTGHFIPKQSEISKHTPVKIKGISNAYINHLHSNKTENTFYKAVKLGNALNEYLIIGKDEDDKEKSFIGGDDTIPDIHRYRSDIDGHEGGAESITPPSLGPRVCEQTKLSKNKLYVLPDGSIDFSHVYFTMRRKSPGLKLLEEQYNTKCTDIYSPQRHPLMLIWWKQTPMRIFGGGKVQRAVNLCN